MADLTPLAARFLELHVPGTPLLMPNPYDLGSALVLQSMGFQALATTSSGFANTLGRHDGRTSLEEAIAHAGAIAAAVSVPVSGDLEGGYAGGPDAVAETVRRAAAAGLAGCSIEDTGYVDTAVARVEAAAAAAADAGIVLTARADGLYQGAYDLAKAISLLQAFQDAGAHVLYAPWLRTIEDVRAVVSSVDRPVNVLLVPDGPTVGELAEAGVARVSVGGAFAAAAVAGLVDAAEELLERGTPGYWAQAQKGRAALRRALPDG